MSHGTMTKPETTEDLVRRLQDLKTDVKERTALQALASKMMSIFNDDRSHTHIYEAAAIAPFQDWHGYKSTLLTFMDAVIDGTADGSILRPELCDQFVSVLRLCDSIDEGTSGKPGERTADLRLEQVMASLQRRLDDAINGASLGAQFQMVDTLARVLDAMNDAKTDGISREKYRDPLLKSLDGLRNSKEIRLAQVASYAYEALCGIPDDEGPYKAALRHMMTFVDAGAKIAGAVATMDPSKLVSGIIALGDVPDLVSSMITVIQKLPEAVDSIRGITHDAKLQQRPKKWYIALRLADVMILNRCFPKLEEFIREVPCRLKFEFLRGLHARLERAWITAGKDGNGNKVQDRLAIQSIIESLPSPEYHSDHLKHIDAWKQALQATIGLKPTSPTLQKDSYFRRAINKLVGKTYSSQVAYPAQADLPTPSALLCLAWQTCPTAQLFYADAELRHYYLDDHEKRLQITRISGTSLSMAQCYINLAIVEQKAEDRNTSSLQLSLNVSDVSEDRSVTLGNLFESRKCLNGRYQAPRRLLIRGRAGIGKTTLCKKIVHGFTHQPVDAEFRSWTERYDRILWIPLRDLKRHEAHPGYSLTEFLKNVFFARRPEDAIFSTALGDHCSSGSNSSRTLFLLDGLDEVSDQLDPDHKMSEYLWWLLRRPDAIITSRPGCDHTSILKDLDCELEVQGFDTRQMWAYINKAIDSADTKADMQKVFDSRPLMTSLMRIPVQLDAFCYIWGDTQSEAGRDNMTSMASIYRLIECRLWHKDIPRLQKMHGSQHVTVESALGLTLSEVDMLVDGETSFLGALAFAGLYHEVVNFELQECDDVRATWVGPKLEGQLSKTLSSLSFLRTSDGNDSHRRTYHFVHLTYQEYFAAQYFVSRWTEGTHLLSAISKFGKRGSINLSPTDFLRQNKYRSRFNIFWRFVAGALSGHNESDLLRFFNELEKQPRDILGPTHLRLVMHCLSEADPEHHMPCFEERREMLHKWALWEANNHRQPSLANETEFPPHMYKRLLGEVPDDIKRELMKSENGNPAARLQYMADQIANNTALADFAIKELYYSLHLQPSVLDILMPSLESIFRLEPSGIELQPDVKSRQSIVVASIGMNLPKATKHVLRLLSDDNGGANVQFAEQLYGWLCHDRRNRVPSLVWQPMSSEDSVLLENYLDSEVDEVCAIALLLPLLQDPLPDSVVQRFSSRLQGPDECLIADTLRYLLEALLLPSELSPAVIQCLDHKDEEIKTCAAELFLKTSSSLSDSDSEAVAKLMGGASAEMKCRIADALEDVERLGKDVICNLVAWSEDESEDIRIPAISALSGQNMSHTDLEKLGKLLKDDPSPLACEYAAKALRGTNKPLPPDVIAILFEASSQDDFDANVADISLRALCRQEHDNAAFDKAVKRYVERSYNTTTGIFSLFYGKGALTLERFDILLEALLSCEPPQNIRLEIANHLGDNAPSSLQSETMCKVFKEFEHILSNLDSGAITRGNGWDSRDNEGEVLSQLSRILSRQVSLDERIERSLLDNVHNGSSFASLKTAKALPHTLLLKSEVVSRLVSLADSDDYITRFDAVQILTRDVGLPTSAPCEYAGVLRKGINRDLVGREFLDLALKSLPILPDEEFSMTLGCNDLIFGYAIAKWREREPENVTLYPDPTNDMYYIVNLPQGQKRFKKEDHHESVEQFLGI